jgi:hypothetical protein
MSILDDFVRIRLYRKQAVEFQWLADNASDQDVQRRYRIIARHYGELADRDEQADKARMAKRLEQLRLKRQQAVQPDSSKESAVRAPGSANDNVAAAEDKLRCGRKPADLATEIEGTSRQSTPAGAVSK